MRAHMLPFVRLFARIRPRTIEGWFVLLLSLSSFIGVWYALPALDVIRDTSGFSGGVLRAMEAHSVIPLADELPYGVVTFYLCYATIAAFLALSFPFFHFSAGALKLFLLDHPEVVYAIARATSAAAVAAAVVYAHRFLRREVTDAWYRSAILMVVFGDILVTAVSRSGKVWVVSSILGFIAVLLCYESVRDDAGQGKVPGKTALMSLLAVSLAAANFVLFSLYAVVFPLLLIGFRTVPHAAKKLFVYAILAGVVGAAFVAINFQNTIGLFEVIFTGYHPLGASASSLRPSFGASLVFHFVQMLAVYPMVVAFALIAAIRGVRGKMLFWISAAMLLVYFLGISYIANWYGSIYNFLRYLYPLGFLFLPLLASLRAPRKAVSIVFFALALAVYIYTIAMMALPTTYTIAADQIAARWGNANVVIDNRVFELALPMNKGSYALLHPLNCASKCESALSSAGDITFKPTVVTVYSYDATSSAPHIIVEDAPVASCGTPLFTAPDGATNADYFDMEQGIGAYLDPAYFSGSPLGKHLFVYDESACPKTVRALPIDQNYDVTP